MLGFLLDIALALLCLRIAFLDLRELFISWYNGSPVAAGAEPTWLLLCRVALVLAVAVLVVAPRLAARG